MLTRRRGTVLSIDRERPGVQEITVSVDGMSSTAMCYPTLTGDARVGDEVLLNTTALEKGLGTGGYHFVMANLTRPESAPTDEPGHIVKNRYTPLQHTVLSTEEEYGDAIQTLDGLPVVVGQLHSQLAPAAAAIKRLTNYKARVVYLMTDSASLPLPFSRLVSDLKATGLIDETVTAGQSFGGNREAVNVFSGLVAAKEHSRADAVIVCPGPGTVGTGTKFGFSSIEQGEIVNAVSILGGTAIAIARISFADERPRHQGLSHHTLTALGAVALTKCNLVLPMMDQMKLLAAQTQIEHSAIAYKHKVRILDGGPGMEELKERGVEVRCMGRRYEDDPEYFLSASAAGALAAEMLRSTTKLQ